MTGCVPVPPHHSPFSRGNVPHEIPAWLEPGRTTLADVFFHLGEPDDAALDQRTFGWVNVDRLGGGILIGAAGGGGVAGGALLPERYRRLVVQVDGAGIVVDRRIETATCNTGTWGAGNAGGDFGGNCLPPLPDTGFPPSVATAPAFATPRGPATTPGHAMPPGADAGKR